MNGKSQVAPVAFGGHFGALHRPCEGAFAADVAVVICPTLGREWRSAYRALFSWAETLASQGFSVLRYDALGEGDSAPIPADAEQCALWLDGVAQAADFARRQTGARQLVLAGLRMGGALALAAASQVRPDGLILLAPLLTGESWLRELRFSAAIQKLELNEAEGLQVDGLHLSAATVCSLRALNVADVAPAWRSQLLEGLQLGGERPAAGAAAIVVLSRTGKDILVQRYGIDSGEVGRITCRKPIRLTDREKQIGTVHFAVSIQVELGYRRTYCDRRRSICDGNA